MVDQDLWALRATKAETELILERSAHAGTKERLYMAIAENATLKTLMAELREDLRTSLKKGV